MITKKMPNPRIIIIGAGVSGIAAASRLISQGLSDIVILEAENRIGGRINTVPFGKAHVDLGAHWVHGEVDNVVYRMASSLNLLESSGDFENLRFILSDGTEIPPHIGILLFERCGMILEDKKTLENESISIAEYITQRFEDLSIDSGLTNEEKKAFLDWTLKFESSIEGCDSLWNASVSGLTHYKKCEGDPIICFKNGGYSNVLDILMGKGRDNEWIGKEVKEKIKFNKEVTEVLWDQNDEVVIKCSDEMLYTADCVIITLSLGVLKEMASSMFKPLLPSINSNAIQEMGIGTVDKIYLYFNQAWWPSDLSGFSFLYKEKDQLLTSDVPDWAKSVIGFYTEKNASNVLCGWIVGEAAKEMENVLDDNLIQATCVKLLRNFIGHLYNVTEPQSVVRSKWYTNKHFRGSYSFRSLRTVESGVSAQDLATPLKNSLGKERVFFAGEATHNYYYSTVHGAIETGWREADRIVSMSSKLMKCSL